MCGSARPAKRAEANREAIRVGRLGVSHMGSPDKFCEASQRMKTTREAVRVNRLGVNHLGSPEYLCKASQEDGGHQRGHQRGKTRRKLSGKS